MQSTNFSHGTFFAAFLFIKNLKGKYNYEPWFLKNGVEEDKKKYWKKFPSSIHPYSHS